MNGTVLECLNHNRRFGNNCSVGNNKQLKSNHREGLVKWKIKWVLNV
jgi:hypothetical protein